MWWKREWVIFWIGMGPLLAAYRPLKAALDPYGFVAVAVLYLIVIRLAANRIALWLERPKNPEIPE